MIIMTRALNMVALPVAMGVKLTKVVMDEGEEAEVPKPVEATINFSALAVTPDTPPATVSSTIEYAEVAAAIVATFKTDRVKTIDALARFNATKGPQLKPENYAAFLKVLQA